MEWLAITDGLEIFAERLQRGKLALIFTDSQLRVMHMSGIPASERSWSGYKVSKRLSRCDPIRLSLTSAYVQGSNLASTT
jgi:ribonuclease HI